MSYFSAGQYIPGDSCLHKMESFPKLLSFFALLATIILSDSPFNYILITGIILLLVFLSKIDFQTMFLPIYRLRAFFIVIFLMNVLFFDPEDPVLKIWIFSISTGGILQGLTIVLRTALAMLSATILTSVTPVMGLVDAIKMLITPLQWLRIPTDEVALILGISLQFIPTIFEETDRIRKAQAARGASFSGGNLKERALGIVPLVVPVFLATFRRADELATAMEARGYRSARRRKKQTSIPSPAKNAVLTAACIALCVVLPMAFHSIPNAGTIFCPMHIPVLLCGLICGWPFGLLCGIAGPVISSLLTQMPVLAKLPAMVIELSVYGITTGILMNLICTGKTKTDLYLSLIIAMFLGRVAAGAAKALIFAAGEYSIAVWVTGHFITAWPALIIHLILIPIVYLTLLRARLIPVRNPKH